MATFQNRLKEAMELRDMNAAELARLSGVNEGAISQYKKGKYKANQHSVEKIAKCLNVSIPWLMGVSDVFGSYENSISPTLNPSNANPKEEKLLSYFHLLNDTGQEIAVSQVKSLTEQKALRVTRPETEEAPPEATSPILKATGTGGGPV